MAKTVKPGVDAPSENIPGAVDLVEELRKRTEEKPKPPSAFDTPDPGKVASSSGDDLLDELEGKTKSGAEPVQPSHEAELPGDDQASDKNPKAPDIAKALMSPEDTADAVIMGIDMMQTLLIGGIVKNKGMKKFTKEDQQLLKVMEAKKRLNPDEWSEEELDLFDRFEKLQSRIKSIPFTEKETDKWRKPVTALVVKYGWQFGPEWSVAMIAAETLGKRVSLAFQD